MSPEIVVPVVAALIAAAVGFTQARSGDRKARRDDVQALIDQLQEERDAAVRERVQARSEVEHIETTHREALAGVRAELEQLRARHRALEDYVGRLRQHINDGTGPPAPAWPAELAT